MLLRDQGLFYLEKHQIIPVDRSALGLLVYVSFSGHSDVGIASCQGTGGLNIWSDWKPSSLRKLRVKDVICPVIILAQLGLIIGSSHPTFSYSQVMLLQAGDARLEKHDPLTCFSHFIGSCLHVFTSSPPPLLPSPCYRSVFDVINTHFLWSLRLFLSFPLHCCYQQDGSGTFWPSLAQHFFLLKASSSFPPLLAQGSGSAFLWNV